MSFSILSPSELLDAGYTKDIINSINDYCQQNGFNSDLIKTDLSDCSTSSIIQYLKEQNGWNPVNVQIFYRHFKKAMNMKQETRPIKNRLSLSLAQSVSSDSEFSSSRPVFIDDNSISASFPSTMISAFSSHRKQKHVTITAPCSPMTPITEAYNLEHMNQFVSNVTNVTDVTYTNDSDYHAMEITNCITPEQKQEDFNVNESMKQIVVDLIQNITSNTNANGANGNGQKPKGNEQTPPEQKEDSTFPSLALCDADYEDTNDDEDILWSPEEQNGFIYIDEADEYHENHRHQRMDVVSYDEQVQSHMRGIVFNMIRDVCFSETRQTSDHSQDDNMRDIVLGIVQKVRGSSEIQRSSDHILKAFNSECKSDEDTVLVIDRPPQVKEDQIMGKQEAIDMVETVSSATECVRDRSQRIKDEQIAEKEEKLDEKHNKVSNESDSNVPDMKQIVLDLIQNITSNKDDVSTDNEQTAEKEDEVVVHKRLSLDDQSHYKSETMVVIEASQIKRYSITVEAPYEPHTALDVEDTIEEGDEEEEDEESEEEEETEEEDDDLFDDEICILSHTEKKLFHPPVQEVIKDKKRQQSSFFVNAQSSQRDVVSLNEINDKEEDEVAADPFAIYRDPPHEPKESIQVQRIVYLLSQYQQLNEKKLSKKKLDKQQCVVRFIRRGNIDTDYTEESLLNDWYFILVHYCNNNILFDKLTQYIRSQMCSCDVLKCAFIKRNYKQYITNNAEPHYYEYNEEEQQTRIRFLDRIHCHLLHSYDFGFKLSESEREYVEDEAGDSQMVAKNEKYVKDKHFLRLRRTLSDKIKVLKRVIGPKRRSVNKFVTQMFHAGFSHNIMTSSYALTVPDDIGGHIKRPTKIEINDNYQFGQKFYYWDYHKKAGWKWYIHARFHSLKQEMISNNLLTLDQWNMFYHEATLMSKTFVAKSYVPSIEKYFGNYFYGIRYEDILSVDHILALLLFSNDYKLQLKLNASYAKRSEHESDSALKQRHSYYAHWAKLICEGVEVFVNTEFYKRVTDFYHNTNCRMYFNDVYASLYTPTSMTRSFEVATCYANEKGLMLHFELADTENQSYNVSNNHYFECNWISPWSNESEILFVGSAAPLKFKSVIQWQLAYNYMHYISAIAITQKMLHGDPLSDEAAITEPVMNAITDMITHQINKEKRKKLRLSGIGRASASVNVADFIYEFFNHFVQNTTYHIQFDLYKMNYDYFEMQKFFFTKHGEWLNFEQLFTLFPHVRYLTVVPGWSAEDCALKLTSQRMCGLYEHLKGLKESVLERISIDQPNTTQLSLKKVMRDFKPMYESIGWNIDCCGWKKNDDSDPQLIIVKNSQ